MPNDPYLDASVAWRIRTGTIDLHEGGYRTVKEAILSSGLAMDVVGLISAGKEADVYLALYRDAPLAVKVYRLYRTSHRGGRPIKQDSAGWLAAHEYEMTRQAWKGGCLVPAPAMRVENMFSMRYLGDEDVPAPRLNDLDRGDDVSLLHDLLQGIEGLSRAGVVHADLSAYNILIHDGRPWFIDFSEAIRVDRVGNVPWVRLEEARVALERGMSALRTYFDAFDEEVDSDRFIAKILDSLDRFKVLK